MNIELYGPGRAGGALAIAATRAGHAVVDVTGRSAETVRALSAHLSITHGAPDLRILAVSDDAIAAVAARFAGAPAVPTVHLSGAVPVTALEPIEATGAAIGCFHPLQTLPDPITGADALVGSWIAVTASEPLAGTLEVFARSLGCNPFRIEDAVKPLYHAAACAASNYTMASLDLAQRLFAAAGVPPEAARPLVEATVANAFTMGGSLGLTGPIARGDAATVARQLAAVAAVDDDLAEAFRSLGHATAVLAGADRRVEEVLE